MNQRLVLFICLAGLPHAAPAATIVLDDYSGAAANMFPATRVAVTPGTASGGPETGVAGVLGGNRIAALGLQAADIPGLDSVTHGVFPAAGTGVYDFNSTAGARGTAVFYYGDFGLLLPPIALSVPDGSIMEFDFLAFDNPAQTPLTIRLELASGASFQTVLAQVMTAGPQAFSVSLDQFSPAIRSNVTGVAISYLAPKAADFRLDDVSFVIPEPGALALLLAGVPLLRARRRS